MDKRIFDTPFPSWRIPADENGSSVVALGCFDGVHLGHRKVLSEAVALAKKRGKSSAVLTFPEPPRNVFSPGSAPPILSPADKAETLFSIGIDRVFMPPFSEEIFSLSPEIFFERILLGGLHASDLFCGEDYTFGKDAVGHIGTLRGLCEKNGVVLHVVPTELVGGTPVSSTRVREALRAGDTVSASSLLGRPYTVSGTVRHGNALARTWGFPTANVALPENVLLPRFGVYFCRASVGSESFSGIANLGVRPTVDGKTALAEIHLFGFSGDLYGKDLRAELLFFHRPEIRFGGQNELAGHIREDILAAQRYFEKEKVK